MDTVVGIGEFSKMSYLSVKALRHYHDVGLLEPAAVDPATGYRRYTTAQVPVAHANVASATSTCQSTRFVWCSKRPIPALGTGPSCAISNACRINSSRRSRPSPHSSHC